MRKLLITSVTALAFVAATSAPASAQIFFVDGSGPPGLTLVNTPPLFGGVIVSSNGVTTVSPYPYFGYSSYYPTPRPYGSYPTYANPYQVAPNSYPWYRNYPGASRP